MVLCFVHHTAHEQIKHEAIDKMLLIGFKDEGALSFSRGI